MNLQLILGNFVLILFVAMVITGVIWCLDVFVLAGQRRARANAALAEFDAGQKRLVGDGIRPDGDVAARRAMLEATILRQPTWVEYSGSFFPVIALSFWRNGSRLTRPFFTRSAACTCEVSSFGFSPLHCTSPSASPLT